MSAAKSRKAWWKWRNLWEWSWTELPLVQILVVVANIQMRTLKTEVEKGSMWTAFGHGLVSPKCLSNFRKRVIIPQGISFTETWKGSRLIFLHWGPDNSICGNTKELRDANCSPRERFLFFLMWFHTLELDHPAIGLGQQQSTSISGVSGALQMALENRGDKMIIGLSCTHNRIRSPRLAASSR